MVLTDRQRKELARFVCNLMGLSEPLSDSVDQEVAGEAAVLPSSVDAFIENVEVLATTTRYANDIYSMWERSGHGNAAPVKDPVNQEPAVASSEKRAELSPAEGSPVNAANSSLEAKSETKRAAAEPPGQADGAEAGSSDAPAVAAPAASSGSTQPPGSAALNPAAKPGNVPAARRNPGRPVVTRPTFHVPNARVGQAYVGKLEGTDEAGKPVRILGIKNPESMGLSFDAETSELRGTPSVAGDHKLSILWVDEDGAKSSGDGLLIVNPDPRSLWKNIEPPADGGYFKENTDGAFVKGPGFKIAAASRRGRSHEHSGTFRDDDFFVNHDEVSGWSVLIVADGAGSAKNSRQGSRLAVQVAGQHLTASLAGQTGAKVDLALKNWPSDPEGARAAVGPEFHYLFYQAGLLAVQAIESEAQASGSVYKDFSTTLLAAAVKRVGAETFLATFWMGDGAIAAYGPSGTVKLMGTPDGGEFAGQTRFLDRAAMTEGFGKRISMGRFPGLPSILLLTDGVSDPRFETDNGLTDPARWDALWNEISPTLENTEPDKALIDWLTFFTPGHHDDRTIAILWQSHDS